jgi:hypothetical protein
MRTSGRVASAPKRHFPDGFAEPARLPASPTRARGRGGSPFEHPGSPPRCRPLLPVSVADAGAKGEYDGVWALGFWRRRQ